MTKRKNPMTKDSQSQINSFARIYDYSDIVSGRVPFFGFRLCLAGKKLNGREARTNKLARGIEGGVIFAKVPLFTSKGVQWGPLISKVNTQVNTHFYAWAGTIENMSDLFLFL